MQLSQQRRKPELRRKARRSKLQSDKGTVIGMVPRLLSPPRRKIFLLRGVDFPDIFSAGPTFLKKLSSRGGDFSDCQQDSPPRRKVFCFRGAVLPGTCLFLPLGFLKTSFSGGCLAWHLLFLPPGFLKTSFSGGSLAWHLLFLPLGFLKVSFSGGLHDSPFAAESVQRPELQLLHCRRSLQSQCKSQNYGFCTVRTRRSGSLCEP